MAFTYTEETREHVRYLRSLGVLQTWPDPDKEGGFSSTPIEMMRLERVRKLAGKLERAMPSASETKQPSKGDDPSNALDCFQERVDAILEEVKSKHPTIALGEVRDSLFYAMGTSSEEIEALRLKCMYKRYVLPGRIARDAVFH